MLLFNVGSHQLDRFMLFTVDVFHDHARLGNSELVAFATHVFKQDGQVQFAPAHHFKNAVFRGFADAQSDVAAQFALQTVPDLTASDVLAFTARQRAVVDAEVHGQRRLVDLQHRQRHGGDGVGNGHTDADVANAIDQHDFTRTGFLGLHPIQALKCQYLVDPALDGFAIGAFHNDHVHHGADRALADATDADTADEGGKVKRGNLQLQRRIWVTLLVRHMLKNGVEQRRHVGAPLLIRRTFYQ